MRGPVQSRRRAGREHLARRGPDRIEGIGVHQQEAQPGGAKRAGRGEESESRRENTMCPDWFPQLLNTLQIK